MEFHASGTPCLDWSGDALILGLSEDALPLSGPLAELNSHVSGLLQELIDEVEFTGKAGSTGITRVGAGAKLRKLGVVGLGATDAINADTLRRAAAAAARLAKKEKCATLGLSVPTLHSDAALTAQALAEGAMLALHQDNRFKSEDKNGKPTVEHIHLLDLSDQDSSLQAAQAICDGVILARELVSAPANIVTPETLAQTAQDIATAHGLELEILEREQCEALGMGAYLGVARASDLPPKFIHLTYRPAGTPTRKLAIVGKGLTFDSGGLNIKGAGSGIEMMKIDMGGAAATLGAAKAIAQLKPSVEVHFISAAAENMISGNAMRPGDILTASNGKTIEVNNTDAEGRLTLADALVFAEKLGVDAIVDLATLTGACIIALGDDIAGLFSENEELAEAIAAAAATAGEKFWRLPMEEKYFDGLKSIVADMKNTGPRPGGSITAALFLKQFVTSTPWIHLDVAGPVWTEKENGYNNPGGTGFGVRTLVQWVLSQSTAS
ncbi:leucyl aminopeptidase [Nodosilinea sp. LEGE 06152]|uniref:leucyl aminopeptidase n=1 Tax=Nodosilinea sp. LEGE 06152 TaxID=2777966 RepID=UPI00187E7F68|nr:leucyl aminopeptidase [Nodosilinea sp. LEGE 06152]MBE9158860.1 leucyl aminopeptidase [Nodosilinea sp. LEGE 06152]